MSKARQAALSKEEGTRVITKTRAVPLDQSKPEETVDLVDSVTVEQVMDFSKEMVSEFRDILTERREVAAYKVVRNADGFIDEVVKRYK